MRQFLLVPVCLMAMAITTATAQAQTVVDVGTGANTSHIHVVFSSGAAYVFNVSYDTASNGIDLLNILDGAGIGFQAVIQDFGFGDFVDGLSYDGHSNVGFGGGDDWWHYWVRESDSEAWVSPFDYGAATRVVSDGSWDGWVYGSDLAPNLVPEPTMLGLLAMGGVVLLRRRRSAA